MAQMLCKKHGTMSPSFVAPKIAELVRNNVDIEKGVLNEIALPLPFDKKGVFLIDSDFIQEFNIPLVISDEEIGFEIYSLLVPICSSCLNEWKQKISHTD